jgi:hypothetical protein
MAAADPAVLRVRADYTRLLMAAAERHRRAEG